MRPLRWMLSLLFVLLVVSSSFGQVFISVNFAPPELPVYEQPPCPDTGYLWTPGYWAYDDDDGYYWVPGTWVQAPEVGYLWTPGYWAWDQNAYFWHPGYWAPDVGFYGGINYGFGYYGNGYAGGYWRDRQFYYNRSVNNVNVTNIRNVYNNTTVVQNTTVTNVSYNGGQGGIQARPTPQQQAVVRQAHVGPTPAQQQHQQAASGNRQLAAAVNHGKPPIAATQKPADFHAAVVPATRGANYAPPAKANQPHGNHPEPRPGNNNQPAETPRSPANSPAWPPQPERPATPPQPEHRQGEPPQPEPRSTPKSPEPPPPASQPRQPEQPQPHPNQQPRPEPPPRQPEQPQPQPTPQPRQPEPPQPRPESQPRQSEQPKPRPENHPPEKKSPENQPPENP